MSESQKNTCELKAYVNEKTDRDFSRAAELSPHNKKSPLLKSVIVHYLYGHLSGLVGASHAFSEDESGETVTLTVTLSKKDHAMLNVLADEKDTDVVRMVVHFIKDSLYGHLRRLELNKSRCNRINQDY